MYFDIEQEIYKAEEISERAHEMIFWASSMSSKSSSRICANVSLNLCEKSMQSQAAWKSTSEESTHD